MKISAIDALTERLNQLEFAHEALRGQCRLWKRLAGGLVLCAFLLILTGAVAQRPKLIEAERFDLVNSSGNTTARLFNTPEGKPVLSFFQGDANVLNLGVSSEGIADMIFFDRAGKPRIILVLAEDNASLGFYDAGRKSGIALSSAADGTAGLSLFFGDRTDRIALGTQPDGTGRIEVLDGSGKVLFGAPAK